MIRLVLRSLGLVLLAAAFASLVVDGTRSIAAQRILQFSVGDVAGWVAGVQFASLLQSAELWPDVAQRALDIVLAGPNWLVDATLGLLLFVAGKPSSQRAGFSNR